MIICNTPMINQKLKFEGKINLASHQLLKWIVVQRKENKGILCFLNPYFPIFYFDFLIGHIFKSLFLNQNNRVNLKVPSGQQTLIKG